MKTAAAMMTMTAMDGRMITCNGGRDVLACPVGRTEWTTDRRMIRARVRERGRKREGGREGGRGGREGKGERRRVNNGHMALYFVQIVLSSELIYTECPWFHHL